MNIRHALQERVKKLLDHFSSCMMPKEGVAIQVLNDFPIWTADELAFIALHTGVSNAALERLYLKSWRLFREQRSMEQKHLRKSPDIVAGAIREIEGQAWERPAPEKAKQTMGGNTFGGASVDDVLEEIRKAGLDQNMHGQSLNDFLKAMGGKKGKTQTREEAMDAARKAKQGRGTYGDTFQEAVDKQRARAADPVYAPNAPAYLRAHLQILELLWPVTREDAKAAHRTQAKKFHPDVPGGNAEKFKRIQLAWEEIDKHLELTN